MSIGNAVVLAEHPMGRESEQHALRAFVERAAERGGALVLSGDPGSGGSMLVELAVRHTHLLGMTVLRSDGAEVAADLALTGLDLVLRPLAPEIAEMGPSQAEPPRVVLALASGTPPSCTAVADAVLALLTGKSARTSFFVVVDGAQWLDRGTAGALGAVARRVAGTRVGVLAAVRTGAESSFDSSGLPGRELGPLSDADAEQLVADACPRMVERVRGRVLEAEEGNPLAPVELPRARATLSAARETFVRLCAQPWVYRTDEDLSACGAGGSETAASSDLTAQRHEVARSLTNRQIAERLACRPGRSTSTFTGSSRSWGCSRGRRCATLSTPLPPAGASASGGDGHGAVSVQPAEGQA